MDTRFSARIKEIRDLNGWTQLEFADKIGCSRATYNHYENGNRHPDDTIIREICKAANISADYLLGLSNTKNPALHAISRETGLSEETIDYLRFYEKNDKIDKKNAMNKFVDFLIREADFDELFDFDNPNPFEEEMKTLNEERESLFGELPVSPEKVQNECSDNHILDAIKSDWCEAASGGYEDSEEEMLIESLGGEAALDPYYYIRKGMIPPDAIPFFEMMESESLDVMQKEFIEKQDRHIKSELTKSHFIDAVKKYLLFDKYDVSLCSSQGYRRLDDEHDIILRLGNIAIRFPSEESSQLIEDMLVRDVLSSLKKLKQNFRKEFIGSDDE